MVVVVANRHVREGIFFFGNFPEEIALKLSFGIN